MCWYNFLVAAQCTVTDLLTLSTSLKIDLEFKGHYQLHYLTLPGVYHRYVRMVY